MREIVIQLLQSPMAKQTCGNIDFQPLQLCACLQTTQSSGRSKGKAKSALWKSCMLKTTVAFKTWLIEPWQFQRTSWQCCHAQAKQHCQLQQCSNTCTGCMIILTPLAYIAMSHLIYVHTHSYTSAMWRSMHFRLKYVCTHTHTKKKKNVPLTVSAPLLSHAGHVHMSKPNPKKKKKKRSLALYTYSRLVGNMHQCSFNVW